ncbi:MAG: NAD-dependent epimerase/dehydratase family protein, partial [Bacteroidota bacterium]
VCRSLGIQSVSFRYQNVYGPGQSLSNPYTGILSIFSTRIRNGKELYIYEDGKETRDFVYIDDVVDATILGIENSKTSGLAFNIGSGVATNVLTVANTLIRHHGTDVPVKVTRNYRVGDIRHNYADITLAKNVLGYTPNWSFEKGVKKFVNWVKTQEVQNDNYETSILEMKSKGLFK